MTEFVISQKVEPLAAWHLDSATTDGPIHVTISDGTRDATFELTLAEFCSYNTFRARTSQLPGGDVEPLGVRPGEQQQFWLARVSHFLQHGGRVARVEQPKPAGLLDKVKDAFS